MKRLLSAAVAAVLLTATQASALVIAAWEPDPAPQGSGIAALSTGPGAPAAGVTAGQLARGGGLHRPTTVSTTSYNAAGFGAASSSAAVAAGDFFMFGFTSTVGYDLDQLAIHYGRNNGGPANQEIFLSVNGGGYESIFSSTLASGASQQFDAIDLTAFDDVTTASFRLVGWNATNASQGRMTVRDSPDFVENTSAGVAIFGSPLADVPVPAALPLLGLGLAGLGLVARRRA